MWPRHNAKSLPQSVGVLPVMRSMLRAVGAHTKADLKTLGYGVAALVMSLALIAIYTLIA